MHYSHVPNDDVSVNDGGPIILQHNNLTPLLMVLKLGRFGQQIRNTWKVLKCGAGEGWRRSFGPIM